MTRLIIFMVFSISVRGILVLGKFNVWVPSIWSRRLWPSVCTVWIYFKVYPISWHNIGKYCSTLYNNFFMMYNCLVYSCTFVFTFVPSVSSKDKIIFICKEKDYHILPNDQNLRLYGHLKIMSTLLFSQALRSDEGQTLELQLFNSSQWAIYAINPVDNTMLPCYTLPLSQHHSFFRNLPPFIHLFFYHNPPFSPPLKKRPF